MNRHHELIAQYCEDWKTNPEPWRLWEWNDGDGWAPFTNHPKWDHENDYRRRPRTIRIGEYDVPEPEKAPDYPQPPDDGQEWIDMRDRKPVESDFPLMVSNGEYVMAAIACVVPGWKWWRPAKLPPPLPDGIPAPKEGWVYAGKGDLLRDNTPINPDIAKLGNEWNYSGWCGSQERYYYAVRVGSEICKKLFPDFKL